MEPQSPPAEEKLEQPAREDKEARLPLEVALRRYWKNLLGLAVYPLFAAIAEHFHAPPPVILVPFFAAGILAAWPHWTKRAPFSYWLVAMGVFMAGAMIAMPLVQLVLFLTGQGPQS